MNIFPLHHYIDTGMMWNQLSHQQGEHSIRSPIQAYTLASGTNMVYAHNAVVLSTLLYACEIWTCYRRHLATVAISNSHRTSIYALFQEDKRN